MKHVIPLLLITLSLTGCELWEAEAPESQPAAPPIDESIADTESDSLPVDEVVEVVDVVDEIEEEPVDNPVDTPQEAVSDDGEPVGVVIGFRFGHANLYLPDTDEYVTVNPLTGELLEQPVDVNRQIYFTEDDCSGTAYIHNWEGEVGKTLIKSKDGRAFVVAELQLFDYENRLLIRSFLAGDRHNDRKCINYPLDFSYAIGRLEEVDSLPDLTELAPLRLY